MRGIHRAYGYQLVKLGYRYLSLKNASWDEETNIFPELFRSAIARVNPSVENGDIDRLLIDIKLLLDNEDLGKAFYKKLTERSGIGLIDLAEFDNSTFHVVTELTCKNGDDEFRPDITLLIKSSGSVFDSIVPNDIEFTILTIPKSDVVEKFAVVVESAFERIANNTKENQHLTQLRDWLLPMLMNGQVTVA